MTPRLLLQIGCASSMCALLAFAEGCGGSLAEPFAQMKSSQMTVYVLQNYQPPVAATPAAAPPGTPPGISQIIQQGLAQVQQWIPGLQLPPGLIPGGAAPTAQPTPEQDPTKYFHGYYILSWKPVTDSGTQSDIATLFGKEASFNSSPGTCFFPNLGFAMASPTPGQPPADVLVSLSPCSQVRAFNFTWPYPSKLGIEPDAEKNIDAIVRKVFGT